MNKSAIFGLVAWVMASALRAAPESGVEVALVTSPDGPHLSLYLAALAQSGEVSRVVLADESGKVSAQAKTALGGKLGASHRSTAALFAESHPVMTLVALEPRLAVPAIEAALEAGSHVLAEKPACRNAPEFEALAAKARKKNLNLSLALANRLNPEVHFARELIAQGKLGRIYGLNMLTVADQTRLGRPAYRDSWFAKKDRAGGGHLIWLGIHWIDLSMFLTGARISSVSGQMANVGGQPLDVEDSVSLSLRFEGGILGSMNSGYYLDRGHEARIKVWGSKGWFEIESASGAETVRRLRYYTTTDENPSIKTFTPSEPAPAYAGFVDRCVAAARGKAPVPVTTEDSLRAIRTVFASYRAIETGRSGEVGK